MNSTHAAIMHNKRLVETLLLLANNYSIQIDLFPEFSHVPDELALLFDDCIISLPELETNDLIDQQQKEVFHEIGRLLDQFSGDDWTMKSLQTSPKWQEIRQKAQQALMSIDVDMRAPNLFWLDFVK